MKAGPFLARRGSSAPSSRAVRIDRDVDCVEARIPNVVFLAAPFNIRGSMGFFPRSWRRAELEERGVRDAVGS